MPSTSRILLFIGRVPLAYNVRNLFVRWRISALTAIVFTAVVGLLTALLAFVNGMYALTADSGQPGNVTGPRRRGDGRGVLLPRLQRRGHDRTRNGHAGPGRPAAARRRSASSGSRSTAANSRWPAAKPTASSTGPVENDPNRRQFVQVRGVLDPAMAGAVHDLPLLTGEWFSEAGVRTPAGAQPGERDQIEAVLGAGVARELGKFAEQGVAWRSATPSGWATANGSSSAS